MDKQEKSLIELLAQSEPGKQLLKEHSETEAVRLRQWAKDRTEIIGKQHSLTRTLESELEAISAELSEAKARVADLERKELQIRSKREDEIHYLGLERKQIEKRLIENACRSIDQAVERLAEEIEGLGRQRVEPVEYLDRPSFGAHPARYKAAQEFKRIAKSNRELHEKIAAKQQAQEQLQLLKLEGLTGHELQQRIEEITQDE